MKRIERGRYEPTRRVSWEPESDGELHETLKALSETDTEPDLDYLERRCRELLAAAGLPSQDRAILVKNPSGDVSIDAESVEWREREDGELPPVGWRLTRPQYLATGNKPILAIDSREGYATRILNYIKLARHYADRGEIGMAMDHALRAGSLAGESRFADWYRKDRRKAQAARWQTERKVAISTAAAIWEQDETVRMGEMVASIIEKLYNQQLNVPEQNNTVRGWLKEASKAGKLTIPPAAQRPGR